MNSRMAKDKNKDLFFSDQPNTANSLSRPGNRTCGGKTLEKAGSSDVLGILAG